MLAACFLGVRDELPLRFNPCRGLFDMLVR
jgi:hypothetical protein